jgi:integrase
MKTKLTVKKIEGLKPDPSGKQQLVWDTELTGFGVLVSGKTKSKSFIVQRDIKGKTRRITLAATNVIDLATARERAQAKLAEMYAGRDPKFTSRSTLGAMLNDYLTSNKSLRPKSVDNYQKLADRYLNDWLDRPLKDITPDDVIERHAEIGGKHPATANLALQVLRTTWNYAAESDDTLPPNPTRRLRRAWYPIERRTRLLSQEQLPKFYRAVMALPSAIQRDYVLMLLFTGMRREECASLTWDEIDLASKTLTVPGNRTKNGRPLVLPLTSFTYHLLKERRALGKMKYVFPGKAGHITDPKHTFRQIKEATGIEVSAHDLRRTYATTCESCELSYPVIKALLNHTNSKDVTAGYLVLSTDRLREPAQKVCDRLKALCRV